VRLQAIARDGGRCVVCATTEALEVDHIVAWQRGGEWYELDNLRTVCRTCHNRKPGRGRPQRKRKFATPAIRSREW
jgi:5-methylcytosine-specific restriction endonuclease McrA